MKGLFISFEGLDGCGKSTQIALLAEKLVAENYRIRVVREPGSTPIGEEIRHLLKDSAGSVMSAETELLLLNSSRAQLVQEVIRPALEQGEIVLCDRYADSSIAYQGYGRRLNMSDVSVITHFATNGLQPDLTFLLTAPPAISKSVRALGDRIEREDIEFHWRVYRGFLQLADAEPARFRSIAYRAGDVTGMHREIYEMTQQHLTDNQDKYVFGSHNA